MSHSKEDDRRRHFEIREVILDKFKNSTILRDRVESLVSSIKADRRAFQAFVVLMIFRSIGESAQAEFMAFRVLNFDPQPELAKYQELWGEVKGRNGITESVESGLFSEFVLSHFCDHDELVRVVEQVVTAIAPIRAEKTRYDAVFAKCLNFGTLYRLCGENSKAIPTIIAGYERLRHNAFIESEPLFWLQMAIANAASSKYREAWNLIKAAYSRVGKEFEPYHIDTKAVDVLFQLGLNQDEQFEAEELDGLDQALEGCAAMVTKDRNRGDVLRALSHAKVFFDGRSSGIDEAHKVRFAFYLSSISAHLRDLSPEMKARQGTETVRKVIEGSLKTLSLRQSV